MTLVRRATLDPGLTAVVVECTPLCYAEGPDAALDRPGHVRAASGIASVPGGIAIVQDDANFVALFDPRTARTRAITLPAGAGGLRQFDDERGNKEDKLDLEACVAVPHEGDVVLLAFGSGSSPRREQVLMLRGWSEGTLRVSLIHLPRLYQALRGAESFSGSELNVEGAIFVGGRIRLLGRGNGAPRAGVQPASATCDLDWPTLLRHLESRGESEPPAPADVVRYELGALAGVSLGFTDATVRGDDVIFSAAAEDSPDAVRDGRVSGSAVGLIERDGRARLAALVHPTGRPFEGKVEGVLAADGAASRLHAVVDADDPGTPSMLCTVELSGDW